MVRTARENLDDHHTQRGGLIVTVLGAGVLLAAAGVLRGGIPPQIGLPLLTALAGAAVTFFSLTVVISDGTLRAHLGPGIPVKRMSVEEIESARAVQNPCYWGWGIRLTPRGMLYNVSGLRGVEIRVRGGGRFTLVTEEPESLARAIDRARRRRE
jgi:hypothetical protein